MLVVMCKIAVVEINPSPLPGRHLGLPPTNGCPTQHSSLAVNLVSVVVVLVIFVVVILV